MGIRGEVYNDWVNETVSNRRQVFFIKVLYIKYNMKYMYKI